MTREEILDKLIASYEVISVSGDEVLMDCYSCGKPKLYFNIVKGVGHCKIDVCGVTPTLRNLLGSPAATPIHFLHGEQLKIKPVEVPGYKVVTKNPIKGWTVHNKRALQYLQSRRIEIQKIHEYHIRTDDIRVYLPIYWDGIVRQYVGRLLPGNFSKLRYKYAKAKFNEIIFPEPNNINTLGGQLTLIENSFVTLSLLPVLNIATTFGSNITNAQLKTLSALKLRLITLLWDEGAQIKAALAVKKLHQLGIPANYILIRGQPDNYTLFQLNELINIASDSNNITRIDLRKNCDEWLQERT